MPGKGPGPSGQTANLGMAPLRPVTLTSRSIISCPFLPDSGQRSFHRMLVHKCNHPFAPFRIPAAGAGSRRSGPSLNSLIRSIPSWLITPRRSFVLRRVGSNFKRMDRSEALLAPKSFFSVVPFAQSSAYSMSRWHSWRRLGGGGVAQGPYDVARAKLCKTPANQCTLTLNLWSMFGRDEMRSWVFRLSC